MELHLKQWRDQQHESEQHQQTCAKIPKLFLEQHQQQALALFLPEQPTSKVSNLSAFPDSTTRSLTPTPRGGMGSYFSMAQWQELQLQALIYRYMLAGAAVPTELLQPIKKSLLLLHSPSSYFLHHPTLPHYQPAALLQSGYWGRGAMDPEPGRCRRTDGKKWRCSRDVVTGHKYCERHMHRGRNRSRKPVEIPTPTNTITVAGAGSLRNIAATTTSPLAVITNGSTFGLSGPSPSINLLHLNQSSSSANNNNKALFESQNDANNRSDGHILRHFFDDWPQSLQQQNNAAATSLSISMPGNPSDVSLKLSTGNGEEPGEREEPQLNWATGWGTSQVTSMGGPLAEALRSSTSNSSPTSVLHQLNRSTASEPSFLAA